MNDEPVPRAVTGGSSVVASIDSGASTISVSWGASTHEGNVRALNEDSMIASPPLFIVADGMGGHDGGDIASAMAVQAMTVLVGVDPIDRWTITEAVTAANSVIHGRSGGGERSM